MPAPTITELPTSPSRADDGETFSANADAFLGALPNFRTELNALSDYLEINLPTEAAAAAQSATDQAEIYRDQSKAAAEASGDILIYDDYATANAAVGGLSESQIVEVIADENYDNERTRYRVESSALVFKFIVNAFNNSDFSYLTQDKSLSYWIRRALVADGAIPRAAETLRYDFANRPASSKAGDSIDVTSDITLARASSAWDWGSDGYLKEFTTGNERYAYDPATGRAIGQRFEEQRTNSLLYNRDLSNGVWSGTASYAADAVGLDGVANSAHTVTDSDGAASRNRVQSVSITSNTNPLTGTIYISKDSDQTRFPAFRVSCGVGEQRTVHLNTQTGVATVEAALTTGGSHYVVDRGSYWQVSVTVTNNNGASAAYYIYPARATTAGTANNAATGSCVYDFGGLEQSADYATTPIPTSGSAVTRLAETATSSIGSDLNVSEFAAVIEGTVPASPDDDDIKSFATWESDTNIFIYAYIQSGTIRLNVTDTTNQVLLTQAPLTLTAGAPFKAAIKIKANDFALSVDGQPAAVDTSGSVPVIDTRRIAANASASAYGNTTITRISEHSGPVSTAELEAMSIL
tara:strand:+ start:30398 stop:32140 length:1743 start_codon:yes stop_codon:yes gene_type:complete